MAHDHCMLNTYGYKHTLRICNTLLFHDNNGCVNASQCYVPRTFPALFIKFSPYYHHILLYTTYRKIHSKIIHIFIRILIHYSFCVTHFIQPAWRPKLPTQHNRISRAALRHLKHQNIFHTRLLHNIINC